MGLMKPPQTVLRSANVVKKLSFSMFLSILTFEFDLHFGLLLNIWGTNELFLGSEWDAKIYLWSTNVVEQLSFYIVPSILTFDFDLISGLFLTFWGPYGLFLGSG